MKTQDTGVVTDFRTENVVNGRGMWLKWNRSEMHREF
jgi:hypothetical protein